VVEGIVSIDRYEVTVTGFANHAGTTLMADRQDALLGSLTLTSACADRHPKRAARSAPSVGW
jgi:N-carbamoyl-L-amino-acid hydrolase